LCRYLVRPAIADARLERTADGRIALELKTPYSDGTTHFVFDPETLLARLAALVPPPRANLVVYHGVLASAASVRRHIVPRGEPKSDPREDPGPWSSSGAPARSRNYTWAELLKRVFLLDVLRCPCGGPRRLIAVITTPEVIFSILRCLGLVDSVPARGPPGSASGSPDLQPTPASEVRLVLE
jgi:hypothetical protein